MTLRPSTIVLVLSVLTTGSVLALAWTVREVRALRCDIAELKRGMLVDVAAPDARPDFRCVGLRDAEGRPRVLLFADGQTSGIRVLRPDGTQAIGAMDAGGSGRLWCSGADEGTVVTVDASPTAARLLLVRGTSGGLMASVSDEENRVEVNRPDGTAGVNVVASPDTASLAMWKPKESIGTRLGPEGERETLHGDGGFEVPGLLGR
jgi:hypothetical protein